MKDSIQAEVWIEKYPDGKYELVANFGGNINWRFEIEESKAQMLSAAHSLRILKASNC